MCLGLALVTVSTVLLHITQLVPSTTSKVCWPRHLRRRRRPRSTILKIRGRDLRLPKIRPVPIILSFYTFASSQTLEPPGIEAIARIVCFGVREIGTEPERDVACWPLSRLDDVLKWSQCYPFKGYETNLLKVLKKFLVLAPAHPESSPSYLSGISRVPSHLCDYVIIGSDSVLTIV